MLIVRIPLKTLWASSNKKKKLVFMLFFFLFIFENDILNTIETFSKNINGAIIDMLVWSIIKYSL